MPTYRGFLAASLAKLALIAPFFAKQSIAGNIEARTVEVIATTYLDLGHCYNACTTKAWHGWQTPGHKSPAYATHTLPAKEGCVTTSIYTKHPECEVCKGTVFVYIPKTEYHARTTTVIKSIHTHTSTGRSTTPTTTRNSSTAKTWSHWTRPSSTSKPSTTRREPTSTRTWPTSRPLSTSSKPSTTRREPTSTRTWPTSRPLSTSSKPSTTRKEPTSTRTRPSSRPLSSSSKPSTTRSDPNSTTTWTWPTSKRSSSTKPVTTRREPTSTTTWPTSKLSSTTKHSSLTRTSTARKEPTSTKRDPHPPTTKPKPTVGDAAAQCGNHQIVSCCNTGNVVGSVLGNLLGGNCKPINIGIVGLTIPLSNACNNQVACCTGDSNGLINLACTNINL